MKVLIIDKVKLNKMVLWCCKCNTITNENEKKIKNENEILQSKKQTNKNWRNRAG